MPPRRFLKSSSIFLCFDSIGFTLFLLCFISHINHTWISQLCCYSSARFYMFCTFWLLLRYFLFFVCQVVFMYSQKVFFVASVHILSTNKYLYFGIWRILLIAPNVPTFIRVIVVVFPLSLFFFFLHNSCFF